MPPRRKTGATARRGGRQAAAANLKVETVAENDAKSGDVKSEDVVKTPMTAASEETAKTDSKRSPSPEQSAEKFPEKSPEKSAKIEEQSDIKGYTEKMDEDPPVFAKPEPPTIDPPSTIPEDIPRETCPKSEAVPQDVAGNDTVQKEAKQESSTVTYPESDTETEVAGTRGKSEHSEHGSSPADVEDMDVEQDGESYLRERFSTERIRHTSPISARVLQNVRALKEEILNGSGGGLNGAPSYSSTLDEQYLAAQEERSSSMVAPALTEVSSATSLDRSVLPSKEEHPGRSQAESRQSGDAFPRSRFSNNQQSPHGPLNKTYSKSPGQTVKARNPGNPSGDDSPIVSGVKRAMDVARSFGLNDPRNFKRQRNDSPARAWQGPGEASRHQSQSDPRWQGNNRQEPGRPSLSDRLADSNGNTRPLNGSRGPFQSNQGNQGASGRVVERAPPAGQPSEYGRKANDGNRERERSPPRRQSRWDQPARGSVDDNQDRPLRNESERTAAGNGLQDSRLDKRPFSSPPPPSKFSPASAQQASRTGASSYSPSVSGPPRIPPNRSDIRDPPQFQPHAQFTSRAPVGPQSNAPNPSGRPSIASNPGPQQSKSGYSRNSQNERTLANPDIPRSQPFSHIARTEIPPSQTVGQNRDVPRGPEPFLPEKPWTSRFSAAPAGPTNQTRGNWNTPASSSLPSLTAANLGRNMQSLPESQQMGVKTISRVSDDGRSALSEARKYVALKDHHFTSCLQVLIACGRRVPLESPGTVGEPGKRIPPGSAALRAELDARHQSRGVPRYRYLGHVGAERESQEEDASRESDRDLRNPSLPPPPPPAASSTVHPGPPPIRSNGNRPPLLKEPYPAHDSSENRNDVRSHGHQVEPRNSLLAMQQRQHVPGPQPFGRNRDVSPERFAPPIRGNQVQPPPVQSGEMGRFDSRGPPNRQSEDSRMYRQNGLDRPPSRNVFDRGVDRVPEHPRNLGYSARPLDNFSPAGRLDRPAPTSDFNSSTLSYPPADERYPQESVAIPRFTSSLVEQELAAMKQKIADLERLRALELSVYGAVPSVPVQRNASPPVHMPSHVYREVRDAPRFDASRNQTFRHNVDLRDQGNARGPADIRSSEPFPAMRDSRDLQGGRDGREARGLPPQMVPSHGPRYNNYTNDAGPRNTLPGPGNVGAQPPRHAPPTALPNRVGAPHPFDAPKAMPPPPRMNDTRPPIRGREEIHKESRMPERDARAFGDRAPIRPPPAGPQPGNGQPFRNGPPIQPWDRRNPAESRDGPIRGGNQNLGFQPGYPAQGGRR